jgi:hypothetical protein
MTNRIVKIDSDDVYLWIEQGSSIHLKATHKGDPVELTSSEARRLAETLIDMADELDRVDKSGSGDGT